jgi:hypothetical protein
LQVVALVQVRRETLMKAETLLGDFIVDILIKTLEGVVKQWQHPLLWGIFVVEGSLIGSGRSLLVGLTCGRMKYWHNAAAPEVA